MADSVLDSMKIQVGEGSCEGKEKDMRKGVLQIERYHHKQVPYFEDKSRADAHTKLRFNIGVLKMVLEELKKSIVGELSWKFNVLWDAECEGVPDAPEEED
ncbi:hypothetical protein D8674_021567 [Pyrus ussuriensis x Pyrus communis]|uniref:Uncharacterized protein n=1 Tax=Pyrus ussuriensis x Pyrus communis TaxID=2448454 RepID=A0A5N5GHH1_9ROSA|nr:hypothetical protein D8674_021567 [Pyrus ussuriensis x Pyrus communis]